MLLKMFRKAVLYIKEIQEIGLFAIMSDADIFFIFPATPLYYVLLPMLGLLLTSLALINGYELAKADNKNFDKWFNFLASATSAVLASVSLYGAVIATTLGLNFAIGPWFFLGSVITAFAHQATMLGLNLYRAYGHPDNSSQRMHYLQASLNNLFSLGLITAITGSVIFVMLTPVAPVIGSICALSAVGFTALSILWRVCPTKWKQAMKAQWGVGKPEYFSAEDALSPAQSPTLKAQLEQEGNTYQPMFSKCDYSVQVRHKNLEGGTEYLRTIIQRKIQIFNTHPISANENNVQKKALLTELLAGLEQGNSFSKEQLQIKYPFAFLRLKPGKGDIEQIIDATQIVHDKYQEQSVNEGSLSSSVLGM